MDNFRKIDSTPIDIKRFPKGDTKLNNFDKDKSK